MGIGGHMLGEKKLHRLREVTGLPLNRACRRNHDCEGVVWNDDGTCTHYEIDFVSGEHAVLDAPTHWMTCRTRVVP
jgi:hypothetical protein